MGITRHTTRTRHGAASIYLSKAAVPESVLSIDESRGKQSADNDEFDPQLQQISALLKPKLAGIEDSADEIGFVTYQVRT